MNGIRMRMVYSAVCLLTAALAAAAGQPSVSTSTGRSRARVYGTVKVEKDKTDSVKSISVVTANKVTYRVTLDENGRKLGEQMDGQRASVLGYVSGTESVRSLTVLSFEEIKKQEPKPPPQRSKPKKRTSGTGR